MHDKMLTAPWESRCWRMPPAPGCTGGAVHRRKSPPLSPAALCAVPHPRHGCQHATAATSSCRPERVHWPRPQPRHSAPHAPAGPLQRVLQLPNRRRQLARTTCCEACRSHFSEVPSPGPARVPPRAGCCACGSTARTFHSALSLRQQAGRQQSHVQSCCCVCMSVTQRTWSPLVNSPLAEVSRVQMWLWPAEP